MIAGSLRVENRLPGADTNPYLTAAATIAAGVAGIVDKIEPDPETLGSGYAQTPPRDFARSMPEAIDRLRGIGLREGLAGPALCRGLHRNPPMPARRIPPAGAGCRTGTLL